MAPLELFTQISTLRKAPVVLQGSLPLRGCTGSFARLLYKWLSLLPWVAMQMDQGSDEVMEQGVTTHYFRMHNSPIFGFWLVFDNVGRCAVAIIATFVAFGAEG